jgi:hypothetical protein
MKPLYLVFNSILKEAINIIRMVNNRVVPSVPEITPRGEIQPAENLCCTHVKKLTYITFLQIGIVRLNVNYCFVCGRRLNR